MYALSKLVLLGALLILFPHNVNSGASRDGVAPFQLYVLDEGGKAIENTVVLVNNELASIQSPGQLIARVEPARLYQIKVSAPGYYSMLHSFSEQERAQLGGVIPNITLVKKIPGRVMIAFGGDAMMGRRYHQPNPGDPRLLAPGTRGEGSRDLLAPIKPYLELADYSSINLETPILAAEPEGKSTKNVTFFSYPETLEALSWAGVNHVSLGNNHTYDYLDGALRETLLRLSNSPLGFSGAGLSASTAREPYEITIQGVPYSFFGFVGWAGKVFPSQVAEGNIKGGAALGTVKSMSESVEAVERGRVAVLEYHGSDEYSFEPTDETRERLRAAIENGADIAIGHHPHVLHGFEVYKGKLIAYSLGNFMFDQYIYETQRSALLYVWMDGEKFHRAEVVPLYIKTYRPTPALGKMREYVLRRLKQQSGREGTNLRLSGGHAVIGELEAPADTSHSSVVVALGTSEQLVELQHWAEEFDRVQFTGEGVSYRVGRDWWSMGDYEQEQQFELVDRSWSYSNQQSGIATEQASGNYAMKIFVPENEERSHARQQYFMRVWDGNPKTLAMDVYAEKDVDVRVCLELRTGAMTTAEGRATPVVRCLEKIPVLAQGWRQLLFDFQPPPREGNRGLRFSLEVFPRPGAGASSVYLDNLKFISWEKRGVSMAGQTVLLNQNRRWNVIGLSPSRVGGRCCSIVKTAY